MRDQSKTKQELTGELISLRQRIAELEHSESDRRQAEEEQRRDRKMAERLVNEMAVIAEIGRIISSTLDIDEVYERFAAEAKKLIAFDRIVVNLINRQKDIICATYTSGLDVPGRRSGDIYPLSGSVNEILMKTRTGMINRPSSIEEITDQCPGLVPAFRAGIRSIIAVPLISRDAVIGGLQFHSKIPNAHTEQDLRLAERIAAQIAGAVASAQLHINLKETEKSLRESEEKYRELVRYAPAGIYEVDYETNRFIRVNDIICEYTGYTRDELFTMNLFNLFTEESQQLMLARLEKLMAGEKLEPTAEYGIRTKNGNELWALINARYIYEAGKLKSATGVIYDITNRKRAEEALKESENKYRLLADNANDVIFVLDMNLNYTYVSPSVRILGGYNPEELLKQTAIERLTPASRDLVMKTLSEVVELEKSEQREIPISRTLQLEVIRKDRTTVWTETKFSFLRDEDQRLVGIIGVTRDISEHKRMDEAIQDSEERHRIMFEASSDAILLRSVGIIIYANPAAFRLFRANHSGDLIGKQYLDLVHPDDRAISTERVKKTMDENWIGPPREHRLLALDGQVVHVESTGIPVKYRGETQIFGVFRDITDRKRAEEERVKLQDQLLQSQKMESVGRLAGGVAHDFNNMLGVILGHADMAIEKADKGQPLLANLQEIRKAADRSSDLTRQLLAFARKQTVSPKVLDMNETVAGMLKMLQRLIGEDIHLTWLPGVNLWPVKIDPSQIDQILANLSVNARDAIDGVGKVTIETENVSFDEAYCTDHAGFIPGEYVLLALSDDGCGMDKEVLGKLFEPFFTTKGVGKGTGLGLATVYGIVKQNNGFINVYSEPDQGTTLKIYLPRHIGKAEQGQVEELQEPIMCGQETVLVVEDELALLDLSKLILEMQGYHVLTAGTPGEAIRLAEEHAGEIHLLITDVVMPEMNGRDLARKMLSLYPNLKRLFMSGYTANVIAHHGILDEGVYFLQKPFSRKDLVDKVRKALDQK